MTLKRFVLEPNGDILTKIEYYNCDKCGKEVCESSPYYSNGNNYHLCCECAFIDGEMSESEYLNLNGLTLSGFYVIVENGELVICWGKKKSGEVKDRRSSVRYKRWRLRVFERDNYTCQSCGQIGGELNAHHKDPWSKNKLLRYNIDNGITLCAKCHKKVHKKR